MLECILSGYMYVAEYNGRDIQASLSQSVFRFRAGRKHSMRM